MKKKSIDLIEAVTRILKINKKVCMKLTDIRRDLPKKFQDEIGVTSKTSAGKFNNIIRPHLENNFGFIRKSNVVYVTHKISNSELVLKLIQSDDTKTPKSVAKIVPFTIKDFSKILNELSESGQIYFSFNEKLEPKICVSKNPPITTPTTPEEKFLKMFDKTANGKLFVRICDLRKNLNWSRNDFDEMLKTLRDKGTIQLHESDQRFMNDEEIENSFVDENNFRMGQVTRNDR